MTQLLIYGFNYDCKIVICPKWTIYTCLMWIDTSVYEKLSKSRYTCAMVFVDHFCKLLKLKLLLRHMQEYRSKDITLPLWNGRFADNECIKHVNDSGQTISFCAAQWHFQHGKVDKKMRDVQDQARKVLLHLVSR